MKLVIVKRTLIICLLSVVATMAQAPKSAPPPTKDNEWSLRGRLIANPHNRDAHDKLCKLLEKQRRFRQADEDGDSDEGDRGSGLMVISVPGSL
jgi:hypothetical protein